MHPYSAPLFAGSEICADEAFLERAGEGEVCFVENNSLRGMEKKAETVILYRWNRTYPADFYLDTPPEECGLVLSESREFEGSSHEKITEEIWIRKE